MSEGDDLLGELDMSFGERVTKARGWRGVNKSELAQLAGLHKMSITLIEQGKTKQMGFNNLFALAKALQVNPEWLATGKGEPHGGMYSLPVSEKAQALAMRLDHLEPNELKAVEAVVKQFDK